MDQINGIKMIPFCIITGFLGSGKTTFLKRVLQNIADKKKIAIIQNEFAPGNIDGTELRSTGKSFKLLEINNGSVFCVCLLSGFIKSLSDFITEKEPELIFLESSGLADPVSIGELLEAPGLHDKIFLAHIWCIVDAVNFLEMQSRMNRIKHQVRIADTVIINKTDLGKDTGTIQRLIQKLNPFAAILKATHCEVPIDPNPFDFQSTPVAVRQKHELAVIEAGGRPDIRSAVIRTNLAVSAEQLNQFLKEYVPLTYRIKGFVKLSDGSVKAVQSSFDSYSTETVSGYSGNTEIIAMGDNIEPRRMRNLLMQKR